MPEMEERALIYDGIKHYFVVNFPQRPGALREFVNDILGPMMISHVLSISSELARVQGLY